MLKINNSVLKINGDWLNASVSPVPQIVYNVILNQTTGGTISAQPMSGIDGTTVTLSNTPATNYTFNGYSISGSTLYDSNKFDINGSNVTCSGSFSYVEPSLPPYTIRLKFKDATTPTFSKGTGVQVSSSPNIWDLTYTNADWTQLLQSQYDLIEVIDANTTGVTNMHSLFAACGLLASVPLFDTSRVTDMSHMFDLCLPLTSVPLYDTSNVTDMSYMFCNGAGLTSVPLFNTSNVSDMSHMLEACTNLTSIPLFDTSKVTDMTRTFCNCFNVQSGALALYQQASTQTTPPSNHYQTFTDCGSNTQTGADELAQIPSSWK